MRIAGDDLAKNATDRVCPRCKQVIQFPTPARPVWIREFGISTGRAGRTWYLCESCAKIIMRKYIEQWG